MSQLPSVKPSPSTTDPSAVQVTEPGFEVTLQAFWNKNRGAIYLLLALVLLGIVGREGWQYFSALREKHLQEQYAQISDQPDKLVAFGDANAGHPLAGVAYLRNADRKFEAADYKGAAASYSKATGSLKNEALLSRAKLGAAISQINGGDVVAGETGLKAMAADQTLPKAARAEATYHLASLAYEAGKIDEVKRLVGDVTKIDLTGPWSQRATALLGNIQSAIGPELSFKPEVK